MTLEMLISLLMPLVCCNPAAAVQYRFWKTFLLFVGDLIPSEGEFPSGDWKNETVA
jgi:hypothetical protein